MIDINHRSSGRPILTVDAETLERANLAGQYLIHVDLRGADLTSAQMPFANLSGADLRGANLSGANLRGANLTEVDLSGADLAGVNLTGATMSLTILSGCMNLHKAVGLETVVHPGPSEMDSATLKDSAAQLPDAFLKGVGYTRSEIVYLRRAYPSESRSN